MLLEGDPSSYIDTLGRQCVAQEQLTLGTPDDTIQLIMEQQSRTSAGSSVDSLNDPAEATCTSRKTLGECPTDECFSLTEMAVVLQMMMLQTRLRQMTNMQLMKLQRQRLAISTQETN